MAKRGFSNRRRLRPAEMFRADCFADMCARPHARRGGKRDHSMRRSLCCGRVLAGPGFPLGAQALPGTPAGCPQNCWIPRVKKPTIIKQFFSQAVELSHRYGAPQPEQCPHHPATQRIPHRVLLCRQTVLRPADSTQSSERWCDWRQQRSISTASAAATSLRQTGRF